MGASIEQLSMFLLWIFFTCVNPEGTMGMYWSFTGETWLALWDFH